MPIIVFASGLIARILERLPWLLYLGAAVLAYTAVGLLLEDPIVRPLYPHTTSFAWISTALVIAAVLGVAWWRNRHFTPASPHSHHDEMAQASAG